MRHSPQAPIWRGLESRHIDHIGWQTLSAARNDGDGELSNRCRTTWGQPTLVWSVVDAAR